MGHQDAFLRPRLSARYRFSQGTLAGTPGNRRDAPIADLHGNREIGRQGSAIAIIRAKGSRVTKRHGCISLSRARATRVVA
jgi:hypothetical protein